MIDFPYISVEQPIGTFYIVSLPSKLLKDVTEVKIRDIENNGVQRPLKESRLKDISEYCSDSNATFPTSVVVSVYDNGTVLINNDGTISIDETQTIGQVLDGQHRIEGLNASGKMEAFQIPVVLMFDMTPELNAYVFSIINSKQTKINPSHIVDLYEFSTFRSPGKTAHMIAKALNSMPESPFYNRLKMLGISSVGQENATLSQGTFAKQLMTLYSRNSEEDAKLLKEGIALKADKALPLRQYFIDEEDSVILKIIINCFGALAKVFVEESANAKKSILWKTTGFSAIIRSFPELYRLGELKKDLSESFFISVFTKVRQYMQDNNIALTGEKFGGGGKQVQQNLTQWIVSATQNV